MKIINYEDFVRDYRPIQNPYFPETRFDGTFFDPMNLSQIAGFITERKLWSLIYRKEVVDKETEEVIKVYSIVPGCQKLNVVGYFATEIAYIDNAIEVTNIP